MKTALTLIAVILLALTASAQTYTNRGGNYCTTYLCTSTFNLTDGGTLELGYHVLDILDGAITISCYESSTTYTWLYGANSASPHVGDQELVVMTLSCGSQSGLSQQTNEVVALNRCGGRGSHACPVFKNIGGVTKIR